MTVKIPGYRILRPIAEGGMASVYLAVQESLGRQVALKLLRKFDNPEQAQRFHNEGHIIASLNHRNIITIFDVGVCDEQHYISMEYLEGGDLEQRIQAGMSAEAALDLLEVMGICLDFLHRKEIIHRDIKPANILFHKDGTPILTDFGVARQLEGDMRLTMEGSAVGSPYYLSPEQAECKPLDGRTDLYGLGIIFHEMLTGVKPYQGDSHIETILAHVTESLPVLPPALQTCQGLLERMIAKDPGERFASAGEMLDYLRVIRQERAAPGLFAGLRNLSRFARPVHSMRRKQSADRTRGTRWGRIAAGSLLAVIASAVLLSRPPSILSGQAARDTAPRAAMTVPVPPPEEVTTAVVPAEKDTAIPGNPSSPDIATAPVTSAEPAGSRETAREENASRAQPPQVKNDPAPKYDRLLRLARKAMDDYRLTRPTRDNAHYYYRRILNKDPKHAEARAGMARIARIYAKLAEQEIDRFRYKKASSYIERGLAIDPHNRRLRELQGTNFLMDGSQRAIGKVKSLFE